MKALIDSSRSVIYVTSWVKAKDKYISIETEVSNSARVCQIEPDDNIFGVADALFWQDCSEEINCDDYYFDLQTKQFALIPESAIYPNQPTVQGVQTI